MIVAEPTPVEKVNPAVTAPEVTAKDVASVAVKVIVEIATDPEKVPNEPEAVTHVGASLTVKSAVEVLTANPSLFSTLTKYVPSTGKVNVAVIEVELVKLTESAGVIAPLVLIASTIGMETNPVPAITTAVASLVMTEASTN